MSSSEGLLAGESQSLLPLQEALPDLQVHLTQVPFKGLLLPRVSEHQGFRVHPFNRVFPTPAESPKVSPTVLVLGVGLPDVEPLGWGAPIPPPGESLQL